MPLIHRCPPDVRSEPQLFAMTYEVDWNDLEWCTLRNMQDPSDRELMPFNSRGADIVTAFKVIIEGAQRHIGAMYSNPLGMVEIVPLNRQRRTVRQMEATPEFLAAARELFHDWRREVMHVLGRKASRWKDGSESEHPIRRQLMYNGVLIIGGKHLHPTTWPLELTVAPPRNNLIGRQFGKLQVIAWKGYKQWLCRCHCGRERLVKEWRLLSGNRTTCGCSGK